MGSQLAAKLSDCIASKTCPLAFRPYSLFSEPIMRLKFVQLLVTVAAFVLCMTGCRPKALDAGKTAPATLSVSVPIVREVTDFRVFTGTTAAVESVDIQARVTGYLDRLPFKEGSMVKSGEILAEIDPRPYEAKLEAAEGEVAVNEAQLELAIKEDDRAKAIRAQNSGAISQQELDVREANVEEATAAVKAAMANLAEYELDLEFTKVISPIHGRVSRYYLTEGNLVTQNETLITTVVSQDPIYVYFDVDEQTMLQVLRSMFDGETPPAGSRKLKVSAALQGDDGFPHEGTVDFANNEVDSSTGTIVVRGRFPNPANHAGVRMLLPGMFVRVKLPIGKPKKMPLIAEKAVVHDQGQTFVYIADDQDQVQYKRVELGRMIEDGLWSVEDGVSPSDRVVVSGVQFAKAGEKALVKEIPMPTAEISNKTKGPSKPTDATTPSEPAKPSS